MKNISLFISFAILAGFISMSFVGREFNNIQTAGPKIRHDSIPDNYFIPDSFCEKFDLQLKSRYHPNMRVWFNPAKNAKYITVNDIRVGFETKGKAVKFFKKNLKSNAENALEIYPKINIPGTKDLHIFRESDAMAKANKLSNINQRYYFFLYLVDYVYVKVFVAASPETTLEEASVFAIEAANSVKRNLAK